MTTKDQALREAREALAYAYEHGDFEAWAASKEPWERTPLGAWQARAALSTAPQREWRELTDDQIDAVIADVFTVEALNDWEEGPSDTGMRDFARAISAALKSANGGGV